MIYSHYKHGCNSMIGVKRNFNNEICGCYCFSFNRFLFCSNCACKIFYFLIEYICRSSVKRKLKILRFWAIHDMFVKFERSCGQHNCQHSFNIHNEPLGVIRTKKNRWNVNWWARTICSTCDVNLTFIARFSDLFDQNRTW